MQHLSLSVGIALAALASFGTRADELDEFKAAFAESRSPATTIERRRVALDNLKGDSKPIALALLEAATTVELEAARIVEQRRRSLFEAAEPDIELQRREVLDPLREFGQLITWHLLDVGEKAALDALLSAALDDEDLPFRLRMAVAERAGDGDAKFASKLIAKMKRKDVAEACVAIAAYIARDERAVQAIPILVKQLGHRSALVREMAARALAHHPDPKGVQALVRRLEKERGRTRGRMAAALEIVTRAQLGDRPSAWQDWWREHEDAVMAGEFELTSGTSSALVTGAPREGRALDNDTRRYHSLSVDGEAVLFLLDRSESMSATMRDAHAEDGAALTRVDRAKQELARVLGTLPETSTFNVVVFSTGTTAFAQTMKLATADNVAKARAWLDSVDLVGGTMLYDGLDYGFQLGGCPATDAPFETAIDTLYLLTDGLPTRPRAEGRNRMFEADSFEAIRAAVSRWNLLGRVVVNAVALGQDFPAQHLRGLAEDNGGGLVQEF